MPLTMPETEKEVLNCFERIYETVNWIEIASRLRLMTDAVRFLFEQKESGNSLAKAVARFISKRRWKSEDVARIAFLLNAPNVGRKLLEIYSSKDKGTVRGIRFRQPCFRFQVRATRDLFNKC